MKYKYRFPEITTNALYSNTPSSLCQWQEYDGQEDCSLETLASYLCSWHRTTIADALALRWFSPKVIVEIQDDRQVLHTFVCQLQYKAKRIDD